MKPLQHTKKYTPRAESIIELHLILRMIIGLALVILISAIAAGGVGLTTTSAQSLPDAHFQPEVLGSISGQVTDEAGNAIENVNIDLFVEGYMYDPFGNPYPELWLGKTTTTDSLGQFAFGGLATNYYAVLATAPDTMFIKTYWHESESIHSTMHNGNIPVSGNDFSEIDIVMVQGGKISGQLATTDGLDFSQYSISIYSPEAENEHKTVHTERFDAAINAYVTEAIPDGTYRVCASTHGDGYYSYRPIVTECYDDHIVGINSAQEISITANSITPNINFKLGESAQYATLSGTLTGPDGEPAAGVEVQAYPAPDSQASWQSTKSDSLGRYVFDRLGPYSYYLKFLTGDSLYLSQLYGGASAESEVKRFPLESGSVVINADDQLILGGQITGKVLVQGKEPARDAVVTVFQGQQLSWYIQSVNVDPITGEYATYGLPEGYYTLSASADGPINSLSHDRLYGTFPENIDGDPISVTLGSTVAGIDISVGEGKYEGEIRGTVSDATGPLEGIRVILMNDRTMSIFSTLTDNVGQYRIEGLTSSTYYIFFSDTTEAHQSQYYGGALWSGDATPISLLDGEIVENIDALLLALQAEEEVSGVGNETNLAPALFFPIIVD